MICAHHFDLPRPNGPTCIGVCRHCGEERVHLNTTDIEMGPGFRSWVMDRDERVRNQLVEVSPAEGMAGVERR